MADNGKKGISKSLIQVSIGLIIAGSIIGLSWLSRHTELFQFYEMIELKLLDQRFLVRGSIPMNQNVGTIDIDALTLGVEGRYQDWTRDKYAEVIRSLHELNARMIGFDVFFPEASATGILKKEELLNARVSSIDEVLNLFQDYDEDMRQAMLEAGNVFLGQSFEEASRQEIDWVRDNIAGKSKDKLDALQALEPYSKEYPDWPNSKLTFYTDIEPPRPKLVEASRGVGYAMTVADIDGSVRQYPVVLTYDGKLWPSLALIMILDYIGAEINDVEINPGKEVILPPGTLPDGTKVNIRIPINEKGLMLVNWAGDWSDEQFFHIPHLALVTNQTAWRQADIARITKKIFLDTPEAVDNLSRFLPEYEKSGGKLSGEVQLVYSLMGLVNKLEKAIEQGLVVDKEDLPEEIYNFYLELLLNHKIARAFEENPSTTLEEMKDLTGERNEDKISRSYFVIKDRFDRGGLKPEDYPLYFFDPVVNEKILRREDIENKVFIYGLTAAGTHDLNPMPYNQRYPMVGLYANIFNTILSQNFLRRAPFTAEVLIILFFGIITGIFVPRFKPLTGAILILLVLAGYLVTAQYLFEGQGLWIDVLGPVMVIVIGFTSITVYSFFSEEKEKKMIRGIFSRYVMKSVVDELIKNPDMVKLGGEKKVLTVFFSDVAGFTTLSEQLSPEELVSLLNEYLTAMTNIVQKYDGMIDKYEGDAIMAVFGTPVFFDDHATRACYVSLEMQEELVLLRKQWKEQGKPELYVRIGLNTGPMVAGNMGAIDRLDYTVMGDSVNLGSRLEGANKQYNSSIMISEFTYEVAKDSIEVRFLDSLRVKGKKLPVKVYELLGKKDNGLPEEMEKVRKFYEQGIEKYHVREWDAGLEFFNKALSVKPGDGPSKVYVERCLAYKENPPPDDWDGVYTMITK